MSSACGSVAATAPAAVDGCTGYAAPATSAYVLPYSVGSTYRVSQGNCSPPGNGHRGSEQYSYDFDMAIGTPVVAARAGIVEHVETSHFDGDVAVTGSDNYIVIRHDDGTRALYGHLTHEGSSVTVGQQVAQGMTIGASGNTGNTGGFRHLHFSVHACDPVTGGSAACVTQPVTFRNADPNPGRLVTDGRYTARPYDGG